MKTSQPVKQSLNLTQLFLSVWFPLYLLHDLISCTSLHIIAYLHVSMLS